MSVKEIEKERKAAGNRIISDVLWVKYFSQFGVSQRLEADGTSLCTRFLPLSTRNISFFVGKLFPSLPQWHVNHGVARNVSLTATSLEGSSKERLVVSVSQCFIDFKRRDGKGADNGPGVMERVFGATPLIRLKHKIGELEVHIHHCSIMFAPHIAITCAISLSVGTDTRIVLTKCRLSTVPPSLKSSKPTKPPISTDARDADAHALQWLSFEQEIHGLAATQWRADALEIRRTQGSAGDAHGFTTAVVLRSSMFSLGVNDAPLFQRIILHAVRLLRDTAGPHAASSREPLPPSSFQVRTVDGFAMALPLHSQLASGTRRGKDVERNTVLPKAYCLLSLPSSSVVRTMQGSGPIALEVAVAGVRVCIAMPSIGRCIGFLMERFHLQSTSDMPIDETAPPHRCAWTAEVTSFRVAAASLSRAEDVKSTRGSDAEGAVESKGEASEGTKEASEDAEGRLHGPSRWSTVPRIAALMTTLEKVSEFDSGCIMTPLTATLRSLRSMSVGAHALVLNVSPVRLRLVPGEMIVGLAGVACTYYTALSVVSSFETEDAEAHLPQVTQHVRAVSPGLAALTLHINGRNLRVDLHSSSVSKLLDDVSVESFHQDGVIKQVLDREASSDRPLFKVDLPLYNIHLGHELRTAYSGACSVFNDETLAWDEVAHLPCGAMRLAPCGEGTPNEHDLGMWKLWLETDPSQPVVVNLRRSLLTAIHPVVDTISTLGIVTVAAGLHMKHSKERALPARLGSPSKNFRRFLFHHFFHTKADHPFSFDCLNACYVHDSKPAAPLQLQPDMASNGGTSAGEREVTVVNSTGCAFLLSIGRPSSAEPKQSFLIPEGAVTKVALPFSFFQPSSYDSSSMYIEYSTKRDYWIRSSAFNVHQSYTDTLQLLRYQKVDVQKKAVFSSIKQRTRRLSSTSMGKVFMAVTKSISSAVIQLSSTFSIQNDCIKPLAIAVFSDPTALIPTMTQSSEEGPSMEGTDGGVQPGKEDDDGVEGKEAYAEPAPSGSSSNTNAQMEPLHASTLTRAALHRLEQGLISEYHASPKDSLRSSLFGVLLPGFSVALPPFFPPNAAVFTRPVAPQQQQKAESNESGAATAPLPVLWTPWETTSVPPNPVGEARNAKLSFMLDERFAWASSLPAPLPATTAWNPFPEKLPHDIGGILALVQLQQYAATMAGENTSVNDVLTSEYWAGFLPPPDGTALPALVKAVDVLPTSLIPQEGSPQPSFNSFVCWPITQSGYSWLYPHREDSIDPGNPPGSAEEVDSQLETATGKPLEELLALWSCNSIHLKASSFTVSSPEAIASHIEAEGVAAGSDLRGLAEEETERSSSAPSASTPQACEGHTVLRINHATAFVNALPSEACVEVAYQLSSGKMQHLMTQTVAPGRSLPLSCHSSQLRLHARIALSSRFSEWQSLDLHGLHTPQSRVSFIRRAIGSAKTGILASPMDIPEVSQDNSALPATLAREIVDSASGIAVVSVSTSFWMLNTTMLSLEPNCPAFPISPTSNSIRMLSATLDTSAKLPKPASVMFRLPDGKWSNSITLPSYADPQLIKVPTFGSSDVIHPVAVTCSLLSSNDHYGHLVRSLLWESKGKTTVEGFNSFSVLSLRALTQTATRSVLAVISPRYVIYPCLPGYGSSGQGLQVWVEGVGPSHGLPWNTWVQRTELSGREGFHAIPGTAAPTEPQAPTVAFVNEATLTAPMEEVSPLLLHRDSRVPLLRLRLQGYRWSEPVPLLPKDKTTVSLFPQEHGHGIESHHALHLNIFRDIAPAYGTIRLRVEASPGVCVRNATRHWVLATPLQCLVSGTWATPDAALLPPSSEVTLPWWNAYPPRVLHALAGLQEQPLPIESAAAAMKNHETFGALPSAFAAFTMLAPAIDEQEALHTADHDQSTGPKKDAMVTSNEDTSGIPRLPRSHMHRCRVPTLSSLSQQPMQYLHFGAPFYPRILDTTRMFSTPTFVVGSATERWRLQDFAEAQQCTTAQSVPTAVPPAAVTITASAAPEDVAKALESWESSAFERGRNSNSSTKPLHVALSGFPSDAMKLFPVQRLMKSESEEEMAACCPLATSEILYGDVVAVTISPAPLSHSTTDSANVSNTSHILSTEVWEEHKGEACLLAESWRRVGDSGISPTSIVSRIVWQPIASAATAPKLSLKELLNNIPQERQFIVAGGPVGSPIDVGGSDEVYFLSVKTAGYVSPFKPVHSGSLWYDGGREQFHPFTPTAWQFGCAALQSVAFTTEQCSTVSETVDAVPSNASTAASPPPAAPSSFAAYVRSWFSSADPLEYIVSVEKHQRLLETAMTVPSTALALRPCIAVTDAFDIEDNGLVLTSPCDIEVSESIELTPELLITMRGEAQQAATPASRHAAFPSFPIDIAMQGSFDVSVFDFQSRELAMARALFAALNVHCDSTTVTCDVSLQSAAVYNMLPFTLTPVLFHCAGGAANSDSENVQTEGKEDAEGEAVAEQQLNDEKKETREGEGDEHQTRATAQGKPSTSPIPIEQPEAEEEKKVEGDEPSNSEEPTPALQIRVSLHRNNVPWYIVLDDLSISLQPFDFCFDQELALRLLLQLALSSRLPIFRMNPATSQQQRMAWVQSWKSMFMEGVSRPMRDLLQWSPKFLDRIVREADADHDGPRAATAPVPFLEDAKDAAEEADDTKHDRYRLYDTIWWERVNRSSLPRNWLRGSLQFLHAVSGINVGLDTDTEAPRPTPVSIEGQKFKHEEGKEGERGPYDSLLYAIEHQRFSRLDTVSEALLLLFNVFSYGASFNVLHNNPWMLAQTAQFEINQPVSLLEMLSWVHVAVKSLRIAATEGHMTLRPDPVFLRKATEALSAEMRFHNMKVPKPSTFQSVLGILFGSIALLREPFALQELTLTGLHGSTPLVGTQVQSAVRSSMVGQFLLLWAKLKAPGFQALYTALNSVSTGVVGFVTEPLRTAYGSSTIRSIPLNLGKGLGSGTVQLVKGVLSGAGRLVSGLLTEASERLTSASAVAAESDERRRLIPCLYGVVALGSSRRIGAAVLQTPSAAPQSSLRTALTASVRGVWEGAREGAAVGGADAFTGALRGTAGLLFRPSAAVLNLINWPMRRLFEGDILPQELEAINMLSVRPRGPRLRCDNAPVNFPASSLALEHLLYSIVFSGQCVEGGSGASRCPSPSSPAEGNAADAEGQAALTSAAASDTAAQAQAEGASNAFCDGLKESGAEEAEGHALKDAAGAGQAKGAALQEAAAAAEKELASFVADSYTFGEGYVAHLLFPTAVHPLCLCFTSHRVLLAELAWVNGYPLVEPQPVTASSCRLQLRQCVWEYTFRDPSKASQYYAGAKARILDRCIDALTSMKELSASAALLAHRTPRSKALVQRCNPSATEFEATALWALVALDNAAGTALSETKETMAGPLSPVLREAAPRYFRAAAPTERLEVMDAVHTQLTKELAEEGETGADYVVPALEAVIQRMATHHLMTTCSERVSSELVQWVLSCSVTADIESQTLSEFYISTMGTLETRKPDSEE